nr:MAG TPA: Fumarate reductase subunit D [Caudoviricetes sp.]
MFWFLFSAAAAILAACVPVMSHMSTFGGDADHL